MRCCTLIWPADTDGLHPTRPAKRPPARPDPEWHSYFEALLVVDAEPVWADTANVVVVGFGAAGGGANAVSGGVLNAGNKRYQKEAGFDDTPEAMFNYLKVETQGVVKGSTLRKFCEDSAANLEWVAEQCATYSSAVHKKKTVYPRGQISLLRQE